MRKTNFRRRLSQPLVRNNSVNLTHSLSISPPDCYTSPESEAKRIIATKFTFRILKRKTESPQSSSEVVVVVLSPYHFKQNHFKFFPFTFTTQSQSATGHNYNPLR